MMLFPRNVWFQIGVCEKHESFLTFFVAQVNETSPFASLFEKLARSLVFSTDLVLELT